MNLHSKNKSFKKIAMAGLIASGCFCSMSSAFAEPARIVGVESLNNVFFGYAAITVDPDSGAANYTCLNTESIYSTLAAIAIRWDSQFSSMDVDCGAGNYMAISLHKN